MMMLSDIAKAVGGQLIGHDIGIRLWLVQYR